MLTLIFVIGCWYLSCPFFSCGFEVFAKVPFPSACIVSIVRLAYVTSAVITYDLSCKLNLLSKQVLPTNHYFSNEDVQGS